MTIPLPHIAEARHLETITEGEHTFELTPETAAAWCQMKLEAANDGIELILVSAFRSVARQTEIVDNKRKQGLSDAEIFSVIARPGSSEHHSGRALDLNTPGCPALEEAFEQTDAFDWLSRNAARFDFHLSYPRNNPYGIIYEPWHWCLIQS